MGQDDGVPQLKARADEGRPRRRQPGLRYPDAGRGEVGLADGGRGLALGGRQHGPGVVDRPLGLIELQRRDDLHRGQAPVSRQIGLSLSKTGPGDLNIGGRPARRGLTGGPGRPSLPDVGPSPKGRDHARQLRLGLIDPHLEVAAVEHHQRIAGFDPLIVLDQDPRHEGRHPRRHGADMAVDLGIVRRDIAAVELEPPPGEHPATHDQEGEHHQGNPGPLRCGERRLFQADCRHR